MKISAFGLFCLIMVYFNTGSYMLVLAQDPETEIETLIYDGSKIIKTTPNEAVRLGQQAMKLADQNQMVREKGRALNLISDGYYYQGKFDLARDQALEAEICFRSLNDSAGIARALLRVGAAFWQMGDTEKSQDYYFESLKISEFRKDSLAQANALNLIGNLYNTWKEFDKALEYYQRSLFIKQELGDEDAIASSLNNIGLIYLEWGMYDTALSYYSRSLEIKLKFGYDYPAIGNTFNNIGDIYIKMGDYPKALQNHLDGLRYREMVGDQRGVASSLNNLARVYLGTKEYAKALQSLNKSLEIDIREINGRNYELLSEVYASMGDNEKALINYKRYTQIQDSLFNEEKYKQITNLEAVYESEKKEQALKILTQENEIHQFKLRRNRIYTFISIGAVIFILIFSWLLVMQYRMRARQRTIELEQKLLRSQMNPHFIFNSLTAIQNFMFESQPAEAVRYLSRFARLMRLILENSRASFVSIEKEIQTLEIYLELQQLRFENKFDYHISIDPEINPENYAIPPMLAQPFIENSIEHGILHKEGKGIIEIDYFLHNGTILFQVKDNGVGREKAKEFKRLDHTSYATQITNERLSNMKRLSKSRVMVEDIKDDSGIVKGTEVRFYIPYEMV